MRFTLCTLTLLSLTLGTADEVSANQRRFGGNIVVTNTTPFAVRVHIRQGPRVLRNVRLQPMESVTTPRVRLGSSKDPFDIDEVDIIARGLEPPIQGETDAHSISDGALPQTGETQCFEIDVLDLDEPRLSPSVRIDPADCNTDPEPPGETPGETTGQLDADRERVTVIASSSGLLLLAFAGYLLGRAPRRRKHSPGEV